MAILNKNQPSKPTGGGLPIRTVILDNGTRLTIVQDEEKSIFPKKGRKEPVKEVQKSQTQEITKLIDLGDGQVISNLYLQGNNSQHGTKTSDPQKEENGSDQSGGQWETVYWDEGRVAFSQVALKYSLTHFILSYLIKPSCFHCFLELDSTHSEAFRLIEEVPHFMRG